MKVQDCAHVHERQDQLRRGPFLISFFFFAFPKAPPRRHICAIDLVRLEFGGPGVLIPGGELDCPQSLSVLEHQDEECVACDGALSIQGCVTPHWSQGAAPKLDHRCFAWRSRCPSRSFHQSLGDCMTGSASPWVYLRCPCHRRFAAPKAGVAGLRSAPWRWNPMRLNCPFDFSFLDA